jgi:hypothetical protein
MLAYHDDQKLKDSVIAQMRAHRKADRLRQGYGYWKEGKGCAVGCLIQSSDHRLYETRFGIPAILAKWEDVIFEDLDSGAQAWPERFLAAIRPGADLCLVEWKFLHWLQTQNLRRARKQNMAPDVIAAIEECAGVLAPAAKGQHNRALRIIRVMQCTA